MWTLLRIAIRNVVRNRRRTLITLSALLVGVGVLVAIRGVLNGLQGAMITAVSQATTGALQVHRAGYMKNVFSTPLTFDFPVDDALLAKIRAVPGVTDVAPRITFAGSVSVGDETLFMLATAVDPVAELRVCPLRKNLYGEGHTFGAAPDGVLLGEELAKAVGAKLGADGILLAPDRDGALNGEGVHFAGNLKSALPGEKKQGVVPLALAQRLLRMEGRATEVAVSIANIEDAPRVAQALRDTLGPTYEVHTWDQIAFFVVQAMARQNFMLRFIGAVFMVLMLLGVANTMLMSALERTREIGTMMAVGVRRGQVLGLFLLEALSLGALGGAVGASAGYGLNLLLNRKGIEIAFPGSTVPYIIRPQVSPGFLVAVVVLAATGAVVFALYPAWRASRLRPVEALAGR